MPPPSPKPTDPNAEIHDQLRKDNPKNIPFFRRLHPPVSPEICEVCNEAKAVAIKLISSQPKAVCLKCNANITKS